MGGRQLAHGPRRRRRLPAHRATRCPAAHPADRRLGPRAGRLASRRSRAAADRIGGSQDQARRAGSIAGEERGEEGHARTETVRRRVGARGDLARGRWCGCPTTKVASATATIAGASMPRLPVISATISMTARGACATPPKSAIMATMTKGAGCAGMPGANGSSSRQIDAPSRPPMTMPGPKTPPEPPEPIESEVARILANGSRRTTSQGQRQQGRAVEAGLHVAVARPQHTRDGEPQEADHEARDSRAQRAGHRPALEAIGQAVEARDVEDADGAGGEPDQPVPAELRRVREAVAGLGAEDRAEALDGAEDRVGHDGRDEGGHERVGLHVVPVEQFGAQHGTAQGRAEDRADAGRHAHRHGDARVALVEVEQTGQEGPEARADLRGGALAPARATRADRDRRGHQLDERDRAPGCRAGRGGRPRSRRRCRGPPPRVRSGRRASRRSVRPAPTTSGIAQGRRALVIGAPPSPAGVGGV